MKLTEDRIGLLFLTVFLLALIIAPAVADDRCKDYCQDRILYTDGSYSAERGLCIYTTQQCSYGCNTDGTACAMSSAVSSGAISTATRVVTAVQTRTTEPTPVPTTTVVRITTEPTPIRTTQVTVAPVTTTVPVSWVTQAMTTTTSPPSVQVAPTSATTAVVTCPSGCECMSRQTGVDRYGNSVRMCSNEVCGAESDGTPRYCIGTTASTTAVATCPPGCECMSRQTGVNRYGNSVRMCSNEVCGAESDGTPRYCIGSTGVTPTTTAQTASTPRPSVAVVVYIDRIVITNETGSRQIANQTIEVERRFITSADSLVGVTIGVEGGAPVYTLRKSRQALILGILPVNMDMVSTINADDMTLIKEEKPWWGFLVSESNPQPSPNPKDLVSESNPQPSPSPAKAYLIGVVKDASAQVETDAGVKASRFNGEILFELTPKGSVTDIRIIRLTMAGDSVGTLDGDTGVISLTTKPQTCDAAGCSNICLPPSCKDLPVTQVGSCVPPACTALQMNALPVTVHYPLIDTKLGFAPSTDDTSPDVFVSKTDLMAGTLSGDFRPAPNMSRLARTDFSGNFDLTLQQASLGKIRSIKMDGLTIPFGWMLNDCGVQAAMFESRRICIQPVFITDGTANDATTTGTAFTPLMTNASLIWKKVCVEFQVMPPKYIKNKDYKILANPDTQGYGEVTALMKEVDSPGCIEVFFADTWGPTMFDGGGATWGLGQASSKIVTCDKQLDVPGLGAINWNHLAHELGHTLALCHPNSNCCDQGCPNALLVEGTPGTVMKASGYFADNPPLQSKHNGDSISNPLLVPVFDPSLCQLEGSACIYKPCCSQPEII